MRISFRLGGLVTAAVASSLVLAACGNASVGSGGATSGAGTGGVKLGVIGSLTGPTATYGLAERNGVQLAVDEVNASGGVLGSDVQVDARDDQSSDPSVDTTDALQLVQSDKVNALFGPIANPAAIAVTQMSEQLGVPIMGTLGATTQVVYPKGVSAAPYPNVFRVLVSSPIQVSALVSYGVSQGWKRWAMIYENDAYGQPTVDDLKTALASAGGQLVSKEALDATATDATAQALAVKKSNPDVVLVWAIQDPASKAVQALSAAGVKTPIMSSNAQASPQFIQLAGPLAEGVIATGLKAQFSTDPAVTKFQQDYKAKFNTDATLWSYASYDAAKIYLQAVQTAGSTDPTKVIAALNSVDYTGVSGSISFTSQQHDGMNPDDVQLVQIKGGQIVPLS